MAQERLEFEIIRRTHYADEESRSYTSLLDDRSASMTTQLQNSMADTIKHNDSLVKMLVTLMCSKRLKSTVKSYGLDPSSAGSQSSTDKTPRKGSTLTDDDIQLSFQRDMAKIEKKRHIAAVITQHILNSRFEGSQPQPLALLMGVLLEIGGASRSVMDIMSGFRVTCSHDIAVRFLKRMAVDYALSCNTKLEKWRQDDKVILFISPDNYNLLQFKSEKGIDEAYTQTVRSQTILAESLDAKHLSREEAVGVNTLMRADEFERLMPFFTGENVESSRDALQRAVKIILTDVDSSAIKDHSSPSLSDKERVTV